MTSSAVHSFTSSSSFLFSLLLLICVGGVEAQQTFSGTCRDVHLFTARGNGEAYPGRIGAMVDSTCGALDSSISCDYEDIAFTSIVGGVYCESIQEGVANGLAQIQAFHSSCPNSKIVLAGYSEGAHIVGDILGGGGGSFYNCYENSNVGLSPSSSPGSNIVAATMFGNTRHTASQSYNAGSGSGDEGEYPRSGAQLSSLNSFAAVIQDYCLDTDPICALGDDGLSHETYMTVFASTAGAFSAKQATSNSSGGGSSGGGAAASSSAAASASSVAKASASASAASAAAASASSAALAAASSASAASAAAASASGASASVAAASIASLASASAASASVVAASHAAAQASVSAASVASVSSASVAAESSASAAAAAQASISQTTTYAAPSDIGASAVTTSPTAQHTSTSPSSTLTTTTTGVESPQTTSTSSSAAAAATTPTVLASANSASRPTDVAMVWVARVAVAVVGALAL